MDLTRLINHAQQEAEKSTHHYKLGTVIFRQGKVISRGHNKTCRGFKGNTGEYWQGSLHAEISAIIAARCNLAGSSILVVRRGLRLARPCVACLAAIKEAGVKSLFYSNEGIIVKEPLW